MKSTTTLFNLKSWQKNQIGRKRLKRIGIEVAIPDHDASTNAYRCNLLNCSALTLCKPLWVYAIPLIVVLLAGIVHLPHPFYGDQALFVVGANELSEGAKLYVDFWDNKQPGIYLFYWLSGALFGYTEIGVHTLELVLYCGLSLFMVYSFRRYYNHRWLACFTPITTIGAYYFLSSSMHLTQVEILVGLPLFLSARLSSMSGQNRISQMAGWFSSGVCAAITVIFKLVLAPIPILMWLGVIITRLRNQGRQAKNEIVTGIVAAFCGGVATLALIVFWFALNDALNELWYTTFIYPLQAVVDAPAAGISRLSNSLFWFGRRTIFLFLLASMLVLNWRSDEREIVSLQMIIWLISGFFVILIQRFSYWQYHFLLLLFPLGILSIRGIDAILTNQKIINFIASIRIKPIVIAFSIIFFAFSPLIPGMGKKFLNFSKGLAKGTVWTTAYQKNSSRAYQRVLETTQFVVRDRSNKPIYVFGDPLYYYLTKKRQAIPEHGWAWEFYMPQQWDTLISKLGQAKPFYLFIDNYYAKLIMKKLPALYDFLDSQYIVYVSNDYGTWYQSAGNEK